MGVHDGPELNRPYLQFSLDPDREPFPLAVYKVSDENYPSYVVQSDGSVLFGSGSAVPTSSLNLAAAPINVTGARDDGSALTALLTALATLGLITDSTTAT